MSWVPQPYELALLTLGGFRLVRLIGWDSITEPLRRRLTDEDSPLDLFITCPWCMGFWVMLGIYGLWLAFPPAVIVVCVPLTLSTLVGLIAKNLDP